MYILFITFFFSSFSFLLYELLILYQFQILVYIYFLFFNLQATEVEKSRAVARRALSTIDTKEEQEKLNIWTALLNLENLYGTKVNI